MKLAAFMGLLLGWPTIFSALFYGVLFAGIGAIAFIVWHRSLKGTYRLRPVPRRGSAAQVLYFLPSEVPLP